MHNWTPHQARTIGPRMFWFAWGRSWCPLLSWSAGPGHPPGWGRPTPPPWWSSASPCTGQCPAILPPPCWTKHEILTLQRPLDLLETVHLQVYKIYEIDKSKWKCFKIWEIKKNCCLWIIHYKNIIEFYTTFYLCLHFSYSIWE